jgi:hypothetical protein
MSHSPVSFVRRFGLIAVCGGALALGPFLSACSGSVQAQESSASTSIEARDDSPDPLVDPPAIGAEGGETGVDGGAAVTDIPAADSESVQTDTPSAKPEPGATTPVPAPGGGSIDQEIEPGTPTTMPEVPLTDVANFGGSITAKVDRVEVIEAQARLPGEIAGRALAVSVTVTNESAVPLDLSGATVTLVDAAGTPASSLTAPPSQPFAAVVDPSGASTGVFVFTQSESNPRPLKISVSYAAASPVVLFVGDPS